MKSTLLSIGSLCLIAAISSPSFGDTTIGNFAGGVAETGWGRFSGGVQPLDADVYTVTDLDTSGDGGALETDIASFSDSFAYSFSTAGTSADWFANNELVFDLIYRGTPTNPANGGFSQVFQVIFQSNFNGFELQSYNTTASAVPLTQFGGGGTSVGWAPETSQVQTVLGVAIDYSSFRDYLVTNGFGPSNLPSTLQFWMSTNDDNRIYKAIDNVRLTGAVPEPASVVLLSLGGLLVAGVVRRRK